MKKSENKKPKNNFELQSWDVTRAQKFEGGNISFDLQINGVTIYGMSLIWDAEKKTYWTAFPSRKGKDGRYYKHAWFPMNETLQYAIEKRIEELLA